MTDKNYAYCSECGARFPLAVMACPDCKVQLKVRWSEYAKSKGAAVGKRSPKRGSK
jgi:hypothetical protein